MREYERKAPDTAKTRIMIGSQHTWEEAFDTVTKELGSYKDPPGWFGRVRKTMRSLGNNKDLALAWANLLPTQSEYFSILCGGLKLVITVSASPPCAAQCLQTPYRPQLGSEVSAMNWQPRLKNYHACSPGHMAPLASSRARKISTSAALISTCR